MVRAPRIAATMLILLLCPLHASADDADAAAAAETWRIGLRAGYGLSYHGQGTLESDVNIPPDPNDPDDDGPEFVPGRSAYSKAIDEVDLAVDVTAPCELGPARPFVTLGGGLGVGRNEKKGGLGTIRGDTEEMGLVSLSGISAMTLEDVAHFYTRVGADFAVPAFGETHPPLRVRPFAGFEVRRYRATLGVYPSIVPFAQEAPPDTEASRSFTDVSPLVGAEVVVPLAATPWGGLDVYLGGEYAFGVNGARTLGFELEDAMISGRADGGNVARLFTGFQLRFDVPR